MATINKTQSSCARVKVLIDLKYNLPKWVNMEICYEDSGVIKNIQVKIQYDHLPKYCFKCNLQGHCMENCRVLHPELRPATNHGRDDSEGATSSKKYQ